MCLMSHRAAADKHRWTLSFPTDCCHLPLSTLLIPCHLSTLPCHLFSSLVISPLTSSLRIIQPTLPLFKASLRVFLVIIICFYVCCSYLAMISADHDTMMPWYQSVTNIFEYSNIFITNIYSDIHSYQFSWYEYIRIFVRIIFLIRIYSIFVCIKIILC